MLQLFVKIKMVSLAASKFKSVFPGWSRFPVKLLYSSGLESSSSCLRKSFAIMLKCSLK